MAISILPHRNFQISSKQVRIKGQRPSVSISIHIFFENGTLQGIGIGWYDDGILDMSPKRVIDSIGIPSKVDVQQWDRIVTHALMLSYETRAYFRYIIAFEDFNDENPIREFCIDAQEWLDNLPQLNIFIINPDAEGIQSLTVEGNGLLEYYVPLEEISDLSVQEFAEALQNDETICLELTNTAPPGPLPGH